MRFTKNNILKSFEGYEQRVIDFLEYVLEELKLNNKVLSNYTLVILQLLATQLKLNFKAQDALGDQISDTKETKYGEVTKPKTEVTVLMQSHKEIVKLLDKLGLSPLEKSKIRKLNSVQENDNEEGSNILGNLMG